VRLLLDNNLSPRLAPLLIDHDVKHVREIGLAAAPDEDVLAQAARDARVLVSADSDFGRLLAASQALSPSVVLLRRQDGRRAKDIARLLNANLVAVVEELAMGAVVVIGTEDIRVRMLPILAGG